MTPQQVLRKGLINYLMSLLYNKSMKTSSSGYQRQLNYKHNDGSYSTFGERGGESQGNTW